MKELRTYQEEAVEAALAAIRRGDIGTIHVATGGGKTVVASEIVRRFSRGHVLWVAKDWILLEQAAASIGVQAPGTSVRRLGGAASAIGALSEAPDGADVVFTTLHTLFRRLESGGYPYTNAPALVIWDECHWGEGSRMGRRLAKYARQQRCPILGLTATPRSSSRLPILHQTTFWDLVSMGYLARPVIEEMPTGTSWSPQRTSPNGDFAPRSLRELGRDKRRNRIIVEYWCRHSQECGRTIVFACDVAHAERLAAGLKQSGASVGVVNCQRPDKENRLEIERYKRGEIDVLVNVAMLTHGFDAPETRTVFLTRPTASPVLYTQMIGRASRVVPGKSEFRIVSFTDNVEQHHACVMNPAMLFWQPSEAERPRRTLRARRDAFVHEFEAEGRPMNTRDTGGHSALHGLRYRSGQTFGVELEMTCPGYRRLSQDDWTARATGLLEVVRSVLAPGRVAGEPYRVHGDARVNYSVWNVEYDGSCGWELVGPKLMNQEGLEEVAIVCDAITDHASRLGLGVNRRTELHVHFGWTRDYRCLQQVIAGTHQVEPLLASIVAPSRLAKFSGGVYDTSRPNEYCEPIASAREYRQLSRAKCASDFWKVLREMDEGDRRYTTVNLIPVRHHCAVEVRMHGGTTEARKVLLWISLWMQLLHRFEMWAQEEAIAVRVTPRQTIAPEGCLVSWLRLNIPSISPEFLERVEQRRRAIRRIWRRSEQLHDWVRSTRVWQGPEAWGHAAE